MSRPPLLTRRGLRSPKKAAFVVPSYLPGAIPFHPAQTLTTWAGPVVPQAAHLGPAVELQLEPPREGHLGQRLPPDPAVTVLRREHRRHRLRHRRRHRGRLPEEEESVRFRPPERRIAFHPA